MSYSRRPAPSLDAPRRAAGCRAVFIALAVLLAVRVLSGQTVAVRHAEGLVHGFLVLTALDGSVLANGDLIQTARGGRVTSRLVFHFKDGSLHDETTTFSQTRYFRLLSGHLVQKGPAFPRPLDMSIDASSGRVTVRYTDDDGEQKVESEQIEAKNGIVNGLVLTLLKNVRPGALPKDLSMVVATPKPRIVKLDITRAGRDPFRTGGAARRAIHYVVKVDIGGLSGLLAPLLGKQPPDSHVWILEGEAPAFVKSEQPLYAGGPLWRIELVSPEWPKVPSPEP